MSVNHKEKLNLEDMFNNTPNSKEGNFKLFLRMYKGNELNIFLSVLFFIIKHSPTWIIPYVTAKVINIAAEPEKHSLNELWIYGIVTAVLLLQNIPFHTLHMSYLSKAVRHVESLLRGALVRKLQILSISFHKELQSGKLQSKVLRDVEAVEFLSRQIMLSIIPAFINIVVAISVTFFKSKIITLFFFFTVPVSVLLLRVFRKSIRSTNSSFRREIEEMSSKVSEMIEMIPVTRAHGLEEVEIEKIDEQLEKVKAGGYKLDVVTAKFGSSSWVVYQLFQVVCLFFTIVMAYNGRIDVGDIVMYQSYFGMLISQVGSIINIYPQIAKGLESINSMSEILLANDIEDNKGKAKVKDVHGEFLFKNVYLKYPSTDEFVLKNFNLDVSPGECIAFVGESGAGKTTILNLLIGFNKATEGSILVDGRELTEIDMRSYRHNIAVVPQNTILFSGSIRDNITYGLPKVSEEKLQRVIEASNLKEFIDKLPDGLNTLVGEQGGKLSGGQRQRIAIARALIRDPKVIILDEATSALDNFSELQVQKALKELVKNRTTFIVAHRLSTIRDADRIVLMKDGECAEVGTYEELLAKKGEFFKLRSLQV